MSEVSVKKARTVGLRLPDNMYKIIGILAKEKKISLSEWIRKILFFHIYPIYLDAVIKSNIEKLPTDLVFGIRLEVEQVRYQERVLEIKKMLSDYDKRFKEIKKHITKKEKATNKVYKDFMKELNKTVNKAGGKK